jgi:2-keto-3-deoxy-L-rhamnonate aldolase RhmA
MSETHRAISPWVNPVTRALREGRVCIGACSIGFAGPAVAQVFSTAGFSWYYVDMEHGRLSYEGLEHISNASKAAGIVPVAGATSIADHLVVRPLDAGAMGVVVPHVETASEVEQIVQWTRYPPIGARGLLPRGVFNNFERVDTVEWIESQNQEVLVAVKVESAAGIDNIDEIASVPGLDAILIGPGDLSLSMGIPGQTGHPDVRDAISKMLRAVKRSGIVGGPHTGRNPKEIAEWVEQGATFMAVTTDSSLLYEISAATVGETKDLLGERLL